MPRLYKFGRRAIDPAELATRVELQRRQETIAPNGEITRTWRLYAVAWCAVKTVNPNEFLSSEQILPTARRVLTSYWIDGVSIGDRAVANGAIYDVVGVADRFGDRTLIDIYCTDYAHDG